MSSGPASIGATTSQHWSRDPRVGCCSLMAAALLGFGLTWLLARHKLQGAARTWVPVTGALAGAALGLSAWSCGRRPQSAGPTAPSRSTGGTTVATAATAPSRTEPTRILEPTHTPADPTSPHRSAALSTIRLPDDLASPRRTASIVSALPTEGAATSPASSSPHGLASAPADLTSPVRQWPATRPVTAADLEAHTGSRASTSMLFNHPTARFDSVAYHETTEGPHVFMVHVQTNFSLIQGDANASMWIFTSSAEGCWRIAAVSLGNMTVTGQWRDITRVFACDRSLLVLTFRPSLSLSPGSLSSTDSGWAGSPDNPPSLYT